MLSVRKRNSRMRDKRLHGCLLLLFFLLANASGSHAETTVVDPDSEDSSKRRSLATGATMFCVAKQGADPTALQTGLNWACGPGHANCGPIQPGGACYKQNNMEALASYAYNDYYQKSVGTGATCSFNGTAMLTSTDPSSGQCIFTGSSMAGGSTPGASAPSGGFTPPFTPFTPGIGSPSNSLIPFDGAENLLSSARWVICSLLLALPLFFL